VTASAVTSRVSSDATIKAFFRVSDQGFIRGRSSSYEPVLGKFSRVIGSRQPRKVRSEDEELTCD
jgi:hypothetical protein